MKSTQPVLPGKQSALIVDEVFLDYGHDGATRPTFATNHDVLTFTLSGVSRSLGCRRWSARTVTSGPGRTSACGDGAVA